MLSGKINAATSPSIDRTERSFCGLDAQSQFLVQSIAARDKMVLQAYVVVIALWMLLINAAARLGLEYLDPRARLAIAITVSILNWTFDNAGLDQERSHHI